MQGPEPLVGTGMEKGIFAEGLSDGPEARSLAGTAVISSEREGSRGRSE